MSELDRARELVRFLEYKLQHVVTPGRPRSRLEAELTEARRRLGHLERRALEDWRRLGGGSGGRT